MKIVIAMQGFKGSISALKAGEAVEKGVLHVHPDADTVVIPIADGGDGTMETLIDALGGESKTVSVTGPFGENVLAEWGILCGRDTAVIEMARSSGIVLVPLEKRNPLYTTTFGFGEVIRTALDDGLRDFIIGIGGSATNDAGSGMAQALGVRLLDRHGRDIGFGGRALRQLEHIEMDGIDERVAKSTFSIACDVNNPLTGPEGAAVVYGPQKGATQDMVRELECAMNRFETIVLRDLGINISRAVGGGAAGGLGAGLIAFLNASLTSGVDIVFDAIGLDKHLIDADLVITGEGCLDYQTVFNKAPIGVARRASDKSVPVVAIVGSLGDGFAKVHEQGIDAAVSVVSAPMSNQESFDRAASLITQAAEQMVRLLIVGGRTFTQK